MLTFGSCNGRSIEQQRPEPATILSDMDRREIARWRTYVSLSVLAMVLVEQIPIRFGDPTSTQTALAGCNEPFPLRLGASLAAESAGPLVLGHRIPGHDDVFWFLATLPRIRIAGIQPASINFHRTRYTLKK